MITERVKGRICGGCTACCTVLPIGTPELRKRPGVACAQCGAEGCRIYETRFPICRTYFCGWHTLAMLGEDWRPDRSGIIVSPRKEGLPPGYAGDGIEFLVFGGEKALRRKPFVPALAAFIESRVATYLAITGPPGFFPAGAFLNDVLGDAVARRDHERMRDTLVKMYRSKAKHVFEEMPE